MVDIPEFDLLNLEDSVFDVHEIVFDNEDELFSLPNDLDSVMKSNPKARTDGVFRVNNYCRHRAYDFIWFCS